MAEQEAEQPVEEQETEQPKGRTSRAEAAKKAAETRMFRKVKVPEDALEGRRIVVYREPKHHRKAKSED